MEFSIIFFIFLNEGFPKACQLLRTCVAALVYLSSNYMCIHHINLEKIWPKYHQDEEVDRRTYHRLCAMQSCRCFYFMPNTLNKYSWHLSESLKVLTCSWALTRISSPGCGSRRPACRPSVCPPRCPGVWGWWNSDDDIDDDDYLDCDVVQEAGARVEAECDEASVGEVGDVELIRGVIVPSIW